MHGFIPDIYHILGKYSLLHALRWFENTGIFLTSLAWKRMVRERIDRVSETKWLKRADYNISVNNDLGITEPHKEYIM